MELARVLNALVNRLDTINRGGDCPLSFLGEQNEDIEEFFQKFDCWAEMHNITEREKLLTLPLVFKDKAFDTYSLLTEEIKANYDNVVTAMKNEFTRNNTSLVAYYRLRQLKVLPGELEQKFYDRLLQKAKPFNLSQMELMRLFIYGYPQELNEFVLLNNPDTDW